MIADSIELVGGSSVAVEKLMKLLDERDGSKDPVQPSTPYEENTPLKFITKDNVDDKETQPFYGPTSADGPTCKPGG